MFERLGSWTYRFRFLIVLAWTAVGGFMAVSAPSLAGSGAADQASFLPAGVPSVVAREAIERAFPGSTSTSSATVTLSRTGGLTAADRAYRDELASWVGGPDAPAELRTAVTGTETADSRPELEAMLRSEDGSLELVVINLDVETAGDAAAIVVRQLREHLEATAPAGLETHLTGAAAISSDYLHAVEVGTDSTTVVTIVLVIAVLLAIYRAPLAALIPLITIAGAFVVSRGLLGFLAAAGWKVSSLLDTFLVVMVFGVGTDYAIFLISRYREEVSGGRDWHDAARITVARIGAVVSASAATVIVGMAAMAFGDFEMVTTTGPGIALAIAVTLAAGLTLAPALLSIFGHYLFWPLHDRPRPEGEPRGLFAGLATIVSRRPGLVTLGLLVGLAIPSLFLPQVRTNFDVLAELPADADSRVGYELIASRMGEDKLVQSAGLIDARGGPEVLAPAQLAKLRDLMVSLHASGVVATTTSIVTPDGDAIVPDGFVPSKNLLTMADGFAGDEGTATDSASLLDPEVKDGLDQALAYVNGLAVAFPEVGAGTELREARAGFDDALAIVDRVRTQSILSTQLRTLAASITDPANAAGGGGGSDAALLTDYLAELAAAYPEVVSLDAYGDGVRAARALQADASIAAALELADAFNRLAGHFDGRSDATLSPESLADTPSAKELRAEAERVFDALPDRLTALSAVFTERPDDIWIPTTLSGEDGDAVRDAIDAFVSTDRAATRFYVTTASDPYSGDAFSAVRDVRVLLDDAAPAFGPAAAAHLGGPTAQFVDIQDTLAADFNRVGVITVVGVLLVLVVLLRSIVAPLYLVATVLISYGSAIGISAFLFQDVLGHAGVSFYLPVIVFVLLVALGSDYNIFLMHRVREESAGRQIRDGVRIASGHTGAVITSAGLVLAGTFGSMATAPLIVLFQVGVAVAIGVLIDTFVVRSVLVPAITALVGDRAWWPSGSSLASLLGRRSVTPVPVPGLAASMAGARGERFALAAPTPVRRVVAIGLAMLLPMAVAGLLTWSFGSASENLGAVRAAVVNLDEGGSIPGIDGSPRLIALGSDLATTLTGGREGLFSWVAADASTAADGLARGEYAAILTIPADFSRRVAAIRTDTTGTAPKATLRVATRDESGYALGIVARAVTGAIGTSTAHDITASYVDDVLVHVTTAHGALTSGATDAGTIAADGASLAGDARGAGALAATVTAGLQQLADGAATAVDGAARLVVGTRQVADGVAALADGTGGIADGAAESASGGAGVADGAAGLVGGLESLEAETAGLPLQTESLATGAAGIAAGTAELADGAEQLAAGLATMDTQTDGLGAAAGTLDAGAAALESGAIAVRTAADTTAAGAADLAAGAGQLANGVDSDSAAVDALSANCVALGGGDICDDLAFVALGGAALRDAADEVAGGASGVALGSAAVASGMDALVSGAVGVHDGTAALAQQLPLLEAAIADSASGAAGIATGLAGLATGAQQVADGVALLAGGMPQLAGGIAELADGAALLATGATALADGLAELADGSAVLASGARQTADGADRVADGTASAAGGIEALTGALGSAADGVSLVETQVDGLAADGSSLADRAGALETELVGSAAGLTPYDADTRARVGSLAADPVDLETTGVNVLAGATHRFAPDFMALATWLAVLGAFLVVPAAGAAGERRSWVAALRSCAAAAAVSATGAVLMVAVLDALLGVAVAEPAMLVGFAILAALAFTAVVQALVAPFGMRGWLAGLLLLVLGIAASGLAFDAAAIPGPLAALRPVLPLAYATDAFHAAVAGTGGAPAIDAVVLVGFLVAGAVITLVTTARPGRPTEEALMAV